MSSTVYRKTEEGRSELASRRGGISPAMRQVLIQVNGSDSVATLSARLGDVRGHLDTLLALKLIEEVEAPRTPPTATRAVPVRAWNRRASP